MWNWINSDPTLMANRVGGVGIGEDAVGMDFKFFGNTTGKYVFWDASADTLYVVGSLSYTGAMQLTGALTVGVNDAGHDVKFFGATSGKYWLWDESEDKMVILGALDITGASQFTGAITVGVNDTGYDVKFFGASASYYWLWDESADIEILIGKFRQGTFHSTAAQTGNALSDSNSAQTRFYADDGGAAIVYGGAVGDTRGALSRVLVTADHSADPLRLFGLMGQIKSYDGEWGNEQVGAVHGYLELERSAGTINFQNYGISAGLMATVETTGTMVVDANHVIAGVAAISKLTSGLTQTGATAGVYVGIYNIAQWSDGTARSTWKYGLLIGAGSVGTADICLSNGETISNLVDGIMAFSGVIQQGATATAALSLGGGTSATKLTTTVADKNFIGFWTESTATTGDSRGMYLRHYLGGTITSAGYGDAIRAFCTVTGTNYDYASGIHATLQINAGASVTGSGAAGRFTLAAAAESRTLDGALAALQLDSDVGAGNTLPSRAALIRLAKSGSVDVTNFLDISDDQCLKGSAATGAATDALPVIMPDGSTLYISLIAAS